MSFEHPLRLVLAAAITVAAAFLYDRLTARKTSNDLVYSNVPFFVESVQPRAWIPAALRAAFVAAALFLGIALTGLRLSLPLPSNAGQVFILLDTSGSMSATDVDPTRAQAALAAARAFIEATPAGTKVGIIAFSSSASLVQPLTADRDLAIAALQNVPEPDGATAIGDALALAAQNLPAAGHRVVVLITDGVNNRGTDPNEVAAYLGAHHVPVYTVGIGTNSGGTIPGTDEEATIDEDALRGYAQVSGGTYARAEDATQLRDALARLGGVVAIERRDVDLTAPLAFAGAALLAGVFLTGLGLGRYP